MDQLRLALAWNRIDVAKSDIFTDDKRWPVSVLPHEFFYSELVNLQNYFFTAENYKFDNVHENYFTVNLAHHGTFFICLL